MRKFDLFVGFLGNGLTVCNRAVMVNGDFKRVAWISPAGNIHWYVRERCVPKKDLETVQHHAENCRREFVENLEKRSEIDQYSRILYAIPTEKFLEFSRDTRSISEKLPEMREYYYTIS